MAIWGKHIMICVDGAVIEGEILKLETTYLTVCMTKPWRSGAIKSGHSGLFGFIYKGEINEWGCRRAEDLLRTHYEQSKSKQITNQLDIF